MGFRHRRKGLQIELATHQPATQRPDEGDGFQAEREGPKHPAPHGPSKRATSITEADLLPSDMLGDARRKLMGWS